MIDTLSQPFSGRLPRLFAACLMALSVAMSCFATSSASAADVRMQAPGSRVSMELPEKFKSSPLFAGFMEIISSAAVIVQELPSEAHDRIVAGFSADALGKKGIVKVRRGQLERSGAYVYLTAEQPHARALFEKFILVIRDERNTAVVTFNVPKGAFSNGAMKREQVIQALTSARLEAKAAPSRDLFKLGYLGPFSLAGQPTGTTRIYSIKGDKGPKEARTLLVVSPSINRLPVNDLGEFSQYALQNLKNNQDLKVQSAKDISIGGLRGKQMVATALRGADKIPVFIRQVILLPEEGGYFRLLTISRATEEKRLSGDIEKVFASFKPAVVSK